MAILVGLPWALLRHLGSPLPPGAPSIADVRELLAGPLSDTAMLQGLACLVWLLWAVFLVDVVRAADRLVRHHPMARRGPLGRLATTLVAATFVALWSRTPVDSAPTPAPSPPARSVAVAHANPQCVVEPPHDGVHDSLWRIADRKLGDGSRWPELYRRTRGTLQPDGKRLVDPDHVRPGWIIQLPPTTIAPPSPASPAAPTPAQPPTEVPTPPSTGSDTTTRPPQPPSPPREPAPVRSPDQRPELQVGLGLVAAVTTAATIVRRRRRRRYRPGSGRRTDLAVPPVVYRLELAHTWQQHPDDEHAAKSLPGAPPDRPRILGAGTDSSAGGFTPTLGVLAGREIALDLGWARGYGLIGPGAVGAVRALLLAALTQSSPCTDDTEVIIPVDLLNQLLAHDPPPDQLPSAVRLVHDLAEGLNHLEADSVRRVRTSSDNTAHTVLLAQPSRQHEPRLQAILDAGARIGITAILVGQWRPGITSYVDADGYVTATSPGTGEALRGARLYQLAANETAHLLTLLHEARSPTPPPEDTRAATEPDADASPEHRTDSDLEVVGAIETADRPLTANPQPRRCLTPRTGPRVRMCVLGPFQVSWRRTADGADVDVTGAVQPRQRELLALLALHPHGVTRQTLLSTLWPDSDDDKPTNALNTAMSRLRQSLAKVTDGDAATLVAVNDGRYTLNPDLVDVDYWQFVKALERRRAATSDDERDTANHHIIRTYRGTLADGIHAPWIEPVREGVRRDALDAVAALARSMVRTAPDRTLDLLELARGFDPHNELLYRDIMRLQRRLGRVEAIPRTLALLTARLAELEETPMPETVDLAFRLQRQVESALPRGEPAQRA